MKNLTICLLLTIFFFNCLNRPLLQTFPAEYIQPDQERRIYTFGIPEADSVEVGEKIIRDFESNFVMAGRFHQEGLLIKRGPFDEPIWQKRTTIPGGGLNWKDMVETANKELLTVGNCWHCYGEGVGDTLSKIYLQRWTPDGDTIGSPVILGPVNKLASVWDIIKLSNGGYAIVGSEYLNAWGGTVMSLYQLNEDLSLLSYNIYNDLYFASARGIVELENGDFAFVGISSNNDSIHVVVRRVSPMGATIWNKIIINTGLQSIAVAGIDLNPGGELIVGGDIPQDSTGQDVYIFRLNAGTGVLIDSLYINKDRNQKLFDLQVTPNGSILLSGQDATGTTYGWRSWIAIANADDELVHEWFFDKWISGESANSVWSLSKDGLDHVFCGRTVYGTNSDLIWGRQYRNGRNVHFTRFPANRQLYARSTSTNLASVAINGFALQSQSPLSALRLEVRRNDEIVHEQDTLLSYQGDTAFFNLLYSLPAENARYDFILYSYSPLDTCLEAHARDVVAGDVFIVQGQSNAVAEANNCFAENFFPEVAEHPFVRAFGGADPGLNDQNWHLGQGNFGYYQSKPGNTGAWGQQIGKLISDELGIPTGVINGATSGREITYFLPDLDSEQPDTLNYNRLEHRMIQSETAGNPRFLFWFQGESDVNLGNSMEDYINHFTQLYEAWKSDYPSLEKIFIVQISRWYLSNLDQVLEIQEAQRQLAKLLPDVEIFSSNAMDQCLIHYEFYGGYELLGNQLFDLISAQYYEQMDDPNWHTPTIEKIAQTDDQLIIHTSQTNDVLQFDAGAIERFYPSSNSIISGMADGNTVVLTLANTDPVASLSYTGPVGGISPMVHNENGIGLVCFDEMPVTQPLTAAFSYEVMENRQVVFTNFSTGMDSVNWDFGDGQVSVEISPAHQYMTDGEYPVILTVSNNCDTLTVEQMIEIKTTGTSSPTMDMKIEIFPNPVGKPLPVQVTILGNEALIFANLYDATGRKQRKLTLPVDGKRLTIKTDVLESGFYFLELIFDQHSVVNKIVID